MDTNKLKKFATEARNKLKAGIAAKIITLGFDKNGNVPEHMHPQLMQGGTLWNGRLETEGFYHQWQALYQRVQQKGIKEVYEEAAYTWFNRLVAIRILMKNGLIEPVLAYVDEARTPRIVDEARMGRMPQMQERQRQLLMDLLDDDSKVTEQFAILITAFCHENPILFRCFGAMSDYTELLLPNDILTEGGFIDLLNHTEFISDTDFRSPELIGWLYQFYISERKDEVFAKKGKFEADEIPAATQIFTPNWIVKYMVQNTIGRIYLDNNPSAASEFKPKWKYLVEPSTPAPKESIYMFKELTELLIGDLACGSGHILNECFDLFYDLYIYEGYSRREAVENIFKCNLRGIDLDTRAKQLATFALMLKACQKDASFADAHILPNVLTMPTPIPTEKVAEYLQKFFRETPSRQQLQDLTAAFELMQDAESLGSIMKFDVAESTLLSIRQMLDYWKNEQFLPSEVEELIPAMDLILTLTDKYAALVMNPPYMGGGNMNQELSDYVKRHYEEGKADLFSTFMLLAIDRLADKGKYGMINMHSWMFLSSFEKLRKTLLDNYHIDSLLHLGPRTFDELSGEVVQNAAFVVSKVNYASVSSKETNSSQGGNNSFPAGEQNVPKVGTNGEAHSNNAGTYFRLVDGKNCSDKERMFLDAQANFTAQVYYSNVGQVNFEKIPGCPIAYWVSESILSVYENSKSIGDKAQFKRGIGTGDNDRFLRLWPEVSISKIGISEQDKSAKWQKYNKGGSFRKWFGNRDYIINWENDGEAIINNYLPNGKQASRPQNLQYNYRKNISYSSLTSMTPSFRMYKDFLNDQAGNYFIVNDDADFFYMLGMLNSNLSPYFKDIKNVTLNITADDLLAIPFIVQRREEIETIVQSNISISKLDWDSHETSWDFEANPLIALRNQKVAEGCLDSAFRLKDFVEQFESIWLQRFSQLHQNEEELNRQFIEIYGLQDELTPDVPLTEITILQQGEITVSSQGLENQPEISGTSSTGRDDQPEISGILSTGQENVPGISGILSTGGDDVPGISGALSTGRENVPRISGALSTGRDGVSEISGKLSTGQDDFPRNSGSFSTGQNDIARIQSAIHWNEDVLMKQLISYAVGVWMGRYKLGTKGLHIAHPNPTDKELQEYWYGGVQVYIDDDAIIPILPQSSPFDDNLVSRIADLIRITFGEEKLTENLNYIEQQLGQSIEQYLLKDFWKDHKKMYQNRPIYWLFSSKKGAFKCLAYMHRMDAYTAERVRSNYLLPYIEYLQNQIADLENRASSLSTTENRRLQNLQKTLEECREYHERLQVVAEQAISFDLDDGVVVNYAKFGDILAKIK